MNQEKNDKLRTTRRGKFAVLLAGLALVGLAVKAGDTDHIDWPGGHEYTQEQLEQFEQAQVVVPEGAGADQIVKGVEPDLVNNQQGFEDVSDYVEGQGTGIVDGHRVLQPRQQVLVPLVSGIPHTAEK